MALVYILKAEYQPQRHAPVWIKYDNDIDFDASVLSPHYTVEADELDTKNLQLLRVIGRTLNKKDENGEPEWYATPVGNDWEFSRTPDWVSIEDKYDIQI